MKNTEIQKRIHASGLKVVYVAGAVVQHHVPADRLRKRYFYRRSFRQRHVRGNVASHRCAVSSASVSLLLFGYPARFVLLVFSSPDEQQAMSSMERIAFELGFLRQGSELLLDKMKTGARA